MHALNYVPKATGGRGQKGGLSEYAGLLGKGKQTIHEYKDAAEVLSKVSAQADGLLSKAKHLSAIHALPKPCWQDAVALMLKKEWSAKETQGRVRDARTGAMGRSYAKSDPMAWGIASDFTERRWTKKEEKQKKKAAGMWLACYTQDEIAEGVGVPVGTLPGWESEFLENSIAEEPRNYQNFKPPIYNVWKRQEKTNTTSHFGKTLLTCGRPWYRQRERHKRLEVALMRKLFVLAMFFFIGIIGPAHGGELAVDRVVDGDTVYLSDGAKIRLYGIDAPERRQPYGLKARDALQAMAAGPVRIEEMDVDRYGRIVAVVWADGVNVNRELVRMGAAWVYDRYCTADFCEAWEALETEARDHRRGLWADPDAVEPWKWRRRK